MAHIFLDMAMSLDGFIAGVNGEDKGLYDWYFSPSETSQIVINELTQTIGAMIMGRKAYSTGDESNGFSDNDPYQMPHFILSRTITKRRISGKVPMFFIADGIHACLKQAIAAAGEKAVCIAGGANTAQQFLEAGLIDEIRIHLAPVLLGEGIRLFDLSKTIQLKQTRVIESVGVTHLRFDIIKNT
jgi:dihydrofolate reductase